MSEQIRNEGEPTSESLENLEQQKHKAFLAAEEEVKKIEKEIDDVFATTADEAEAKKIILERFADKRYAAQEKEMQAFREWFKVVRENRAKEEKMKK